MHAQPVSLLKTGFGIFAGRAEQLVVLVEALNQGQRDVVCIVAVEADRNFHGGGLCCTEITILAPPENWQVTGSPAFIHA
jgi:hypothetical protein